MARISDVVYDDALPKPPAFAEQAISQMGRYGQGGLPAPTDQRGAADLSGLGRFLTDPVFREEMYHDLSGTRRAYDEAQRRKRGLSEISLAESPDPGLIGPPGKAIQRSSIAPVLTGLENLSAIGYRQRQMAGLEDETILPLVGGVGAVAGRGASKIDDVAKAVPGFAKTAEQLIAERMLVERVAPDAPKFGKDLARQLGVNLDQIAAPDEVKSLIQDMAIKNEGFLRQRRGVIPIAETMAEAAKYIPDMDVMKLAAQKPGTAVNAETLWATKTAMVKVAEEVLDLQQQIAAVGVEHASTALKLKGIGKMAELSTLQRVLAGERAEAGRSLRILREIASASDGTPQSLDRALEAVGGRKNADSLLSKVQDIWADPRLLPEDKERATYAFLRNLDDPSFFDKIQEFWLNSVLSGPPTHIINTSSNTIFGLTEGAPTRFVAAAVEAVSTLGGKRQPREVFFSEASYGAYGALMGLGPGIRKFFYVLRNGFDVDDVVKFRESGSLRRQNLQGLPGDVLNAPTRLLGAEDGFFKMIGYQSEMYAQAARTASKEKLSGGAFHTRVAELVSKPTTEMLEAAKKQAQYVTFTSAPDALTKHLMEARGIWKPLRFVAPFIQTPMNLMKRGLEYSPAGVLKVITGKAQGADASTALARSAIGTGLMAYFAGKMVDGTMTAGAPIDAAEKDAFYRSGRLPYAVKIGDNWVEYRRIEPLATPLIWMAAAMDAFQRNGTAPPEAVVGKMLAAISRSVIDATYLQGISDFIDALEDPERYGSRWLDRLLAGFVPFAGLTRSIAQSQDPYVRKAEGLVEEINAMLPTLDTPLGTVGSTTLPARTDVFGREIMRPESKQGLGAFQPFRVQPETYDRVDAVLSVLDIPQGLDAEGRPLPPKKLQVGFTADEIASLPLSGEEADRYQSIAGQETYTALDALFRSPEFVVMNNGERVAEARRAIAKARTLARSLVADEIVQGSSDPAQIARGAVMKTSVLNYRDTAFFVEALDRQGKLSPSVSAELDKSKDKDEPTVAEYLRAAPHVREYLAQPKYRIGNAAEWERLELAEKAMRDYLLIDPKPSGIAEWQWYYRHDPAGANLIRKYSFASARNPKRAELKRKYPFIERFVT